MISFLVGCAIAVCMIGLLASITVSLSNPFAGICTFTLTSFVAVLLCRQARYAHRDSLEE